MPSYGIANAMKDWDSGISLSAGGIIWNAAFIAGLVTIMAAGELLTVIAALLWSLTGLLHAPAFVAWGIGLTGGLVGLWLCWRLYRSAYRGECDLAAAERAAAAAGHN